VRSMRKKGDFGTLFGSGSGATVIRRGERLVVPRFERNVHGNPCQRQIFVQGFGTLTKASSVGSWEKGCYSHFETGGKVQYSFHGWLVLVDEDGWDQRPLLASTRTIKWWVTQVINVTYYTLQSTHSAFFPSSRRGKRNYIGEWEWMNEVIMMRSMVCCCYYFYEIVRYVSCDGSPSPGCSPASVPASLITGSESATVKREWNGPSYYYVQVQYKINLDI